MNIGLFVYYKNDWISIINKSNNLTWNSDMDTIAVQLNFDSLYDIPENSQIFCEYENIPFFRGTIIKKTNKSYSSSYVAMDFMYGLNKPETKTTFQCNTNASTAVTQLLGRYNIHCDVEWSPAIINKIYSDKTPADIIKEIKADVQSATGQYHISEFQNWTFRMYDASNDIIKNKVFYGNDFEVTRSIENYEKEAKKEIRFTLLALEKGYEIKAHRLIYVPFTKYGIDNYFRIKSASHTLSNNKHTVQITI